MAVAAIPAAVKAEAVKLLDDFPLFAEKCLKIRTKSGELKPLLLNRGQRHFIDKLETTRKAGKPVRAIVVKGRQLGISTVIQGYFYWLLWRSKRGVALKAYILTHEQKATDNLFGMAERFHEHMPQAVKPSTRAANAKEMIFAENGCSYAVGTAGSKEVGRSDTIQLFHGSEVPSWPNAESHVVSLLTTAIAGGPGTVAVLEATAKGIGNVFHRLAMGALRGENEYEAIFIPWHWGDDYQTPCPEAWASSVPEKWHEYAVLHALTWEQVYWAYARNKVLASAKSLNPDDGPCPDFRQEFPATFEEAFQSSGNSFIPALSVLKARQKRTGQDKIVGRGPIILGVDPALRQDKLAIIDKCGRTMGERICERWPPGGDIEFIAAKLARVIDRIKPDAVNIDTSENGGVALFDILTNRGYHLNPVSFGSAPIGYGPTGEELYANRRAEMWDALRDWFETPGGVQIPDDDALHTDLTAPEWGPSATRHSPTTHELILEPKEKIRERIGASPDLGDAAALCFAVPFAANMQAMNQPQAKRRANPRTGY